MLSVLGNNVAKDIHIVVGARPNQMKAAPLLRKLRESVEFTPLLIDTGQHYDHEMAGVFFEQFGMGKPDYSLGVGSGSHGKQTAQILSAYEEILLISPPAAVIVIGDVNSTVACSLAATKLQIPTIHLEAGLRSNDRTMPEELNRIVTDHLCDMLWTPSPDGDENLRREGISPEKIIRVGNIMIDTLVDMKPLFTKRNMRSELGLTTPHVLLTLHRPSNVDTKETLEQLLSQLIKIGETHSLVWPMHPRTRSRIEDFELEELIKKAKIHVTEPLGYIEFMSLVSSSIGVITDSGGIQEETTYLGVPCLTVRPNTERPITIMEGTNKLISPHEIVEHFSFITDFEPKTGGIEFWDGNTAQRCVESLSILL